MWGATSTFRRTLIAAVLLVCSVVVPLGRPAAAQTAQEGTPPPEAFVVVDAGTGAVLTSRHLHEALPPASTVKIMTGLVAIERLPPDAPIVVSPNAAGRESTTIGMKAGQKWPLDQALASMMMVSANDAAYAIAETVGGSVAGFAADATATAKRYGMRDSTFSDPAGLTDGTSYRGGPRMSAYDLAIATRNALTVPAIAQWAAMRTYQFTDVGGAVQIITNHNKFLPDNGFGYQGSNGFKTGYTQIANHTLVATANRNGRQLIAVILGAVDSGYTWAASLLDAGFATSPDTNGTGIRLPAVAVSPYGTRVAQRDAFVRLARGNNAAPLAAAPTGAAPSADAGTDAASTGTRVADKRRGGVLTMSNVLIVLVLLVFVMVLLRRRAVKRQRARRIARRARANAMRSGSLTVVDGRYRSGTRVGPPVESQVRVERTRARNHVDLTREDPIRSSARGTPRRRHR